MNEEPVRVTYGDLQPPGAEVEVSVRFSYDEIQKMLIQAAVDKQAYYEGTWGGRVIISANIEGPEVTARADIWKEKRIIKR